MQLTPKTKRNLQELLACEITAWERNFVEGLIKKGYEPIKGQIPIYQKLVKRHVDGDDSEFVQEQPRSGAYEIKTIKGAHRVCRNGTPIGPAISINEGRTLVMFLDCAEEVLRVVLNENDDLPYEDPDNPIEEPENQIVDNRDEAPF